MVFTFDSMSAMDAGTYQISLKAVMTNTQEHIATFTLEVQTHCGSLSVTTLTLPDVTYYISS